VKYPATRNVDFLEENQRGFDGCFYMFSENAAARIRAQPRVVGLKPRLKDCGVLNSKAYPIVPQMGLIPGKESLAPVF
jgi:hypothetical protein